MGLVGSEMCIRDRVYIISGFDGLEGILSRLGKHKTGKSCLYVKRLADLDLAALEELVSASVRRVKEKYGTPRAC